MTEAHVLLKAGFVPVGPAAPSAVGGKQGTWCEREAIPEPGADEHPPVKASHFDFIDVVVTDRDLVVTIADDHVCRREPRESALAWHCDLDDGTTTGEDDSASFVRWVWPAPRIGGADEAVPLIDVRPAELTSIRVTREGLLEESASWWGSSAALVHQIGLAVDIADRLATRAKSAPQTG